MLTEIPIDGILDLHQFHPRDVIDLVDEYLSECFIKGIKTVRIITGKGKGVIKARVFHHLKKHPNVIEIRENDYSNGNWGVLIIFLKEEKKG